VNHLRPVAGDCASRIEVFEMTGGTTVAASPELQWALSPMWSPDGTRLAWSAMVDDRSTEPAFVGRLPLNAPDIAQVTRLPGSSSIRGWMDDHTLLVMQITCHGAFRGPAAGPLTAACRIGDDGTVRPAQQAGPEALTGCPTDRHPAPP
jgi:hypothetical protein